MTDDQLLMPNLLTILCFAISADSAAAKIQIDSALVTAAHHAEVPAREAGLVTLLLSREGQRVAGGELIGRLDDADAKLAV